MNNFSCSWRFISSALFKAIPSNSKPIRKYEYVLERTLTHRIVSADSDRYICPYLPTHTDTYTDRHRHTRTDTDIHRHTQTIADNYRDIRLHLIAFDSIFSSADSIASLSVSIQLLQIEKIKLHKIAFNGIKSNLIQVHLIHINIAKIGQNGQKK